MGHDSALHRLEDELAFDHLTLCLGPDNRVDFFPDTADSHRLAERLCFVVELLHRLPPAIACAAGACEDGRHD